MTPCLSPGHFRESLESGKPLPGFLEKYFHCRAIIVNTISDHLKQVLGVRSLRWKFAAFTLNFELKLKKIELKRYKRFDNPLPIVEREVWEVIKSGKSSLRMELIIRQDGPAVYNFFVERETGIPKARKIRRGEPLKVNQEYLTQCGTCGTIYAIEEVEYQTLSVIPFVCPQCSRTH